MSARRKRDVILMLAEGETDLHMLAPALTKYFAERAERFITAEPFRCDVTTLRLFPKSARDKGILPPYDDARRVVDDFVREHVRDSEFSYGEYMLAVQLIDLDGAFIPAKNVVERAGLDGLEYGDDVILTPDRRRLLSIHDEKRRQVNALLGKHRVLLRRNTAIPYQLFFMSRNLEHALAGIGDDLDAERKMNLAALHGMVYGNDPGRLMEDLLRLYAMNIPRGVAQPTLKDTWDWAMTGVNSLHRNSNLILLPKLASEYAPR